MPLMNHGQGWLCDDDIAAMSTRDDNRITATVPGSRQSLRESLQASPDKGTLAAMPPAPGILNKFKPGDVLAPKRLGGDPRYHSILRQMAEIHDAKNKDYGTGGDPLANFRGSATWGVPGWVGAMIRCEYKLKRLKSLQANGRLENESAEDSFLDAANYMVLALILFREEIGSRPPAP